MPIDPNGKIVFVNGANRGIGKAIVEAFVAAGAAKVYAAVRDLASAKPLVEAHGDKIVPVEFDLSKPELITAAAKVASDAQIVVNNAGVLKTASALDPSAFETMQYEIEMNVYGLMRTAQAFAPVLKANGGGALVQLNSVASFKAFPPFSTYCASKAASYSITQALKSLLGEQGTEVVSVHPGPISTDMADAAGLGDIGEPPSQVADALIEALKAGTMHVYTDTMSRQVGEAYSSFAKNVVEADMPVG